MLVLKPVFSIHQSISAADVKLSQTSSATSMDATETPTAVTLKPPPINHHKSVSGDDLSAKLIILQKKTRTTETKAVQYSIADVQMATDSFSVENLIGDGSIGSVYRAHFGNGKVISLSHGYHKRKRIILNYLNSS